MNRPRDATASRGRRIRELTITVLVFVGIMFLSCGLVGPPYFKDRLNQVTQQDVESRYGPPHARDPFRNGGEAWTYFERGSATAGFVGTARNTYCRAYVLGFDARGVMRSWTEQRCKN